MQLLDQTLEQFLNLHCAAGKTKEEKGNKKDGKTNEVLQVIGIARFNPQTNTDVRYPLLLVCVKLSLSLILSLTFSLFSLRDSQYDCLKSLKIRNVFKTLELLTNWMNEGMFDFCSLPFSLKTDMMYKDRDQLRCIANEAKGKGDG